MGNIFIGGKVRKLWFVIEEVMFNFVKDFKFFSNMYFGRLVEFCSCVREDIVFDFLKVVFFFLIEGFVVVRKMFKEIV